MSIQSGSNKLSRREMLERSMLATAGAMAAAYSMSPEAEAAQKSKKKASVAKSDDKLLVCCVGVNGRGKAHYDAYAKLPDTEVAIICDADEDVGNKACEAVAKLQDGRKPKYVQDLRKAYEDKSISLVSIATPNHWHALAAIWAMQAGKDVYVEKPVSHNVSEGRRMTEVSRKLDRICQVGTQSRSHGAVKEGMKYIHDGNLGKILVARGVCFKDRDSIGPKGDYKIPKQVNYDLWSGPAPILPLTREKLHYDWHWQWPYGNGDLGNQGIHQMDLCRYALGVDGLSKRVFSYGGRFGYTDAGETPNTMVVVHDYGDKSIVFEVRRFKNEILKIGKVHTGAASILIECENGYLVIGGYGSATVFDKDGNVSKHFNGDGDSFGDFVSAVKEGKRKPNERVADILEGHLSSALCHTGNISYRLGKQVGASELAENFKNIKCNDNMNETFERISKHLEHTHVDISNIKYQMGAILECDSASESFPGNSAANAFLTRDYRKGFEVPAKA